jgi:UDP-N-acetylglucosamine---dolichyl-phosphate N-acetylglucosaminyltransferase
MRRLAIVLPAFNEEKIIKKTLKDLKKELLKLKGYEKKIVVVDDGSKDKTVEKAKSSGVLVLKHVLNRGLGGALATGLEYAKRHDFDLVLTFDADGQHDPKDIKKVLRPLEKRQADVVIGVRNLAKMPFDRRVLTFASSVLTFIFFGVWCSDTQSGFRGFSKKSLEKIKIKTQRMEVSSEFFYEIKKHDLKMVEVPIKVIYTKYSRAKGQQNLNALNILVKLVMRLFR